jgi:LCP family protein required for cell wall assembly
MAAGGAMSRLDEVDCDAGQAPSRSPRGKSRARLRRRIAAWVSVSLTFVLVAAALGAYVEYRNVVDSIHHVNITGLGKRPPKYGNALNILLIGSDSRRGANARFGASLADGPQRSDTVILLHISPGHKRATVVSFPRDSVVPILSCAPDGKNSPGQQAQPAGVIEQINSTFANGGPACLWKTVEHVTGIRVDHFVELNFTGFIHVINDLGGVNVCLPVAIDNANSGLHLSAGEHHVRGSEALAFWRTRENVGEGSDLQRIQRDQFLMASLLQGIEHSDLLGSPTRIFSVVKDVADAMTTDMYPSTLLQIANSMKGVSSQQVQFVEAPTVPYPANAEWVQFAPQSAQLFTAIAHDKKLPKTVKKKTTGHGTVTPVLDASPSQVSVKVLNGSGVTGIAGTAAASLNSRGFDVVGTGDDPPFGHTSSVIEYASATEKPAVKTLKKQLSDVVVQQDSSLTPGTLVLIIGSSYQGLVASPSHSPKPSKPSVGNLAKSFNGITGNASCQSDTNAFYGPNSPGVP